MTALSRVLDTFERYTSLGFVVGGCGILGTSIVGSLDVAGILQATATMAMGPLLVGLWFVFVGVIGSVGYLGTPAPRLGRVGRGAAVIGFVIWSVALVAVVAIALTTSRTFGDPGPWGPPLLTAAFVLALVSFLFVGIASVRSGEPDPLTGWLLLVPVAGFLGQAALLASKIVTGEVVAVLQLGFGGVIAIAVIAVGYRLREQRRRTALSGTESAS